MINAFFPPLQNGIPDVTCQQYQAKNMECSAINTCMDCQPNEPCYAVEKYPTISVTEYGGATDDDEIMAESKKAKLLHIFEFFIVTFT